MSHIDTTQRIFNSVSKEQGKKGIDKYGSPLDPLDNYDWLDMCMEEIVDGSQYLVAEMIKRNTVARKVRMLACQVGRQERDPIELSKELLHWCDVLTNTGGIGDGKEDRETVKRK